MEFLKKSFDVFFDSGPGVVVIKGDWGVGKTYFWEDYIKNRIAQKNLKQIAYSYVSLFGKNSLSEIKSSVFQSAKAIAPQETIIRAFELELQKADDRYSKFVKFRGVFNFLKNRSSPLGKLTGAAKKLPVLDKFSSFLSVVEYNLVDNYVVCFDDIERKGSGLSIKELMGLVDELAQRKSCKVVLIFNEKSFDKDGRDLEQFQSYREKVVDVELLYNPSCERNFNHVFTPLDIELDFLKSTILKVGVKNVRVLRKLKALLTAHADYLKDKRIETRQEFCLHAAALCVSYYAGESFIKYEDLRSGLAGGTWARYLSMSSDDMTPGQIAYKNINEELRLSESKFDIHIGNYLDCGFVDEDAFINAVNELEERYRVSSVDTNLKRAWAIYHDSFCDNANEFVAGLKFVLDNDLKSVGLSDFSSAIEMLRDLGEDVDGYIDTYVEANYDSFKDDALSSSLTLERVKDEKLKTKVIEAGRAGRNYTIDEVAFKIATDRTWNQEDIAYLHSLTIEDFVEWLHSNPAQLPLKLRSGLLSFRNLATSSIEDSKVYESIGSNVVQALKVISSESEFNRIRMKNMYGLQF